MDRRMLVNAIDAEECRIAITENDRLVELEIESNVGKKLKGNIYKARIARIEPSLQAAFLDIGSNRNGFLQINDIHPSCYRDGYTPRNSNSRVNIQDVLEAGQDLVVQVVKEEREQKGATLTTYLSLPGRYLVIMPGSERAGVSRKISDSESRTRLRRLSRELEIPHGIGMIIRTAGLDRSLTDLSRDLSLQLALWERIVAKAQSAQSPAVLYQESDVVTRVVRDYFTPQVREILIDDADTYHRIREFVDLVMPRYRSRIRHYTSTEPIFTHYRVEEAVNETMDAEVKLPSGGAIVIQQLEALVAIDVNSGKATGEQDIEETAYKTNLEAANEIARQLRLRDLGGLIVVDFIDMINRRHKEQVVQQMHQAVSDDKARTEVGKLSRFGLLEMSRQRLRASLSSQAHLPCPTCQGHGKVRNNELVALEVLRKIQSAVIVGRVGVVKARVSPATAMFLLNNRKRTLVDLETTYNVRIFVLADGRLRPDEFAFEMGGPASTQRPIAESLPSKSEATESSDERVSNKPLTLTDEEGEGEGLDDQELQAAEAMASD